MKTISSIAVVALATIWIAAAVAQSTPGAIPVTMDNFVRAESDKT
jgi:hypothetical protein